MSLGKLKKIGHFLGPVDRSLPPVFLNSMPKAGTNLLEKCLILHGYRRSLHNTYNEHNVGRGISKSSPGRFKVGHLFADDSIHNSAFRTIFVHRHLWPCVRSYVNYMFMDTSHQASAFIREGQQLGQAEAYLERLIFGDENPLGRSVLFEYVRFYELDFGRYDLILGFEQFKHKDLQTAAHLAQFLGLSTSEGSNLMQSALSANTWTKNDGAVDIFKDLDPSFVESAIGRIENADRMTASTDAN